MIRGATRHSLALGLLLAATAAASACGPSQNTTATGTTAGPGTTAPTTTGSDSNSGTTAGPTTGTSTSTDTGPDPATSSTTDCDFVCEPDLPADSCDVFAQDCPEGEKCAPYDSDGNGVWDDAKCVEVTGTGEHGAPCTAEPGPPTGVDDCAKGHICWNTDQETGEGVCVAQCQGTIESPSCGEYCGECIISAEGWLTLCLPCSPAFGHCYYDGFEDGTCIYDPQEGFVCMENLAQDQAPAGTGCELPNDCNQGHVCVDKALYPHPDCGEATGCCARYCNPYSTEPDANPGCLQLGDAVPNLTCQPLFPKGESPCLYDTGLCLPEAP